MHSQFLFLNKWTINMSQVTAIQEKGGGEIFIYLAYPDGNHLLVHKPEDIAEVHKWQAAQAAFQRANQVNIH